MGLNKTDSHRKNVTFEIDPLVLLMAQIVVVVYTVLVAFIGYLAKDSQFMAALDYAYHVSANIEKHISVDFDSGYEQTFIFDDMRPPVKGAISVPQTLWFKKSDSQSAVIFVKTQSSIESGTPGGLAVQIKIDNLPWNPINADPAIFTKDGLLRISDGDVPFIRLETEAGPWKSDLGHQMHSLTIDVPPHPGGRALITLTAVVTVSNEHEKSS